MTSSPWPAVPASTLIATLAAGLALPAPALAQTVQLRAGLWENSIQIKSEDGRIEAAMQQMQAQLAALPPAQRQQMQALMEQQGLGLGSKPNAVKICMTQAQIERAAPPPAEPGCTQNAKRSGNAWQISFQCSGPPPSSGSGSLNLVTPTRYEGQFQLRVVEDGKPMQLQMQQRGQWLGADCGAVKPMP